MFRRVLVVVAVAVFMLGAPLAAASDQCMAMGVMCEGPCGASACVTNVGAMASALPFTAPAFADPFRLWISVDLRVLELPPRPSLPLV
jgi:hypothetical protein